MKNTDILLKKIKNEPLRSLLVFGIWVVSNSLKTTTNLAMSAGAHKEDTMDKTFTHFDDGVFVSENSHRKPDFFVGEFEDIFDTGKVVVSWSVSQIRDALCDGELLGELDVSQEQVERIFETLLF